MHLSLIQVSKTVQMHNVFLVLYLFSKYVLKTAYEKATTLAHQKNAERARQ